MSSVTYRLPDTLSGSISEFASKARDYEDKRLPAADFKAYRTEMGVYEQRRDESYMARVRTTGGVITPAQLRQLIAIARAHGSDLLHLTTRQEIQIQDLALDEVDQVLTDLQAIGLATKGGGGNTVRNILVSELSGIGAEETFDTTPYAMELTSRLIAEPDSYGMPRKLKFAFSSAEGDVDYAAINDLGLVARIKDGRRGFRVYVGGGGGNKPTVGWLLYDFLPAEELYALAKGLKNFFLDYGNRKVRSQARLRFVFYKLGEEETLRLIKEYYEKARTASAPLDVDTNIDERPPYAYRPVPSLGDAEAAYRLWRCRYVTPQRQQGYCSVLFPVLLGNIWLTDGRMARLDQLLGLLQTFGDHTLRFTNTQNIRLRNIPEHALPELYLLLRDFKDETAVPVMVNNIISCTGADMCRIGICLSKGLVTAIRDELLRSGLDLDRLSDVAIHVTGCPNSCGQQLWADLGFAGRAMRNGSHTYPGYQVFLSASRHDHPALSQPIGCLGAHDVPRYVCRLLAAYLQEGAGRSFADYLKGDGRDRAIGLLADYAEVPAFEADSGYYTDWGADRLFGERPH